MQIRCPFYRFDDEQRIGCEAPFDGATVTLRFTGKRGKEMQRDIFCAEHFKRCEIYRCIMANKYPEENTI